MTKKDLMKIIQEVVRKEVKKEVQKIFIKEETSPLFQDVVVKKPKFKKEEVSYTSNKTLNKVLNETAGGIEGNGEFDEYPDFGGGTFDSSRMTELLGYGADNKEVQREVGAVQTLKDAGVASDQVPEGVVNAMTRDYSDLMKVMNKGK